MQIGKYDERIEFVSYGTEPDGAGGTIPVRNVLMSSFASIEQLKQSKSLEQVQMGLPSAFRVRMMVRKDFEITTGKLVEWKGSPYHVLTSPQVESTRYQQEWIFDIGRQGG